MIPCQVDATVRNLSKVRNGDGAFDVGVEFDCPVQHPGRLGGLDGHPLGQDRIDPERTML